MPLKPVFSRHTGGVPHFIDEPFNGLDPESVLTLKEILAERRDDGAMILFSVHNLELALDFCDEVMRIDGEHNLSKIQ